MKNETHIAFSLVEMLMALLVASLLMVALAPVMTRKMSENIGIKVEGEIPGLKYKSHEIEYGKNECTNLKSETDSSGNIISEYCEGEFTIPNGLNGTMRITVVGAGGGGSSAPSAGYMEYTTVSNSHKFTVPAGVMDIEATLISGGSGGAGGRHLSTYKIFKHPSAPTPLYDGKNAAAAANIINTKADGTYTWTIPKVLRGKYATIDACGGGGGGGGASRVECYNNNCAASGGGGASWYQRGLVYNATGSSMSVIIGGGGGGGGGDRGFSAAGNGGPLAGGGGGGVNWRNDGGIGGLGGSLGGAGGTASYGTSLFSRQGRGGGAGNVGESGITAGKDYFQCGNTACTNYAGSPNGGDVFYEIVAGIDNDYAGGGGGGSITSGYGGGGGGGSLGAGGGGGGGAATTVVGSYWSWDGGGGGGGGCDAQEGRNRAYTGGGGGGGGSFVRSNINYGGGKGSVCHYGLKHTNATGGGGGTYSANGAIAGIIANNIFGDNFCNGGAGIPAGGIGTSAKGGNGKPGIMKINYLDYGEGGQGGGRGNVIINKRINVDSGKTLTVTVGEGTSGENAPYINSSGTLVSFGGVAFGTASTIVKEDGTILANTGISTSIAATGGLADGFNGGKGASPVTPYTPECEGNTGGTEASPVGKTATKGYGCGGGGGYGLTESGAGTGGYVRISWNKYWDAALDGGKGGYKYAEAGAGGGGASGNIMSMDNISVKSGEKIKIRIGKGGAGGNINNNTVIEAKKGGDTVFAYDDSKRKLQARGGNPGMFLKLATDNTVINGTGGSGGSSGASSNSYCTYKGISYLNNALHCIPSTPGHNADKNTGGKGTGISNLPNLLKNANIKLTSIGGREGITGDNNANGGNAAGYGAGGGGAGILDIGVPNLSTINPNKGGNGSDGKIIIEWWE